jgi:hypothetical protein
MIAPPDGDNWEIAAQDDSLIAGLLGKIHPQRMDSRSRISANDP